MISQQGGPQGQKTLGPLFSGVSQSRGRWSRLKAMSARGLVCSLSVAPNAPAALQSCRVQPSIQVNSPVSAVKG